jgi:calcineurin-like phosphoesterase
MTSMPTRFEVAKDNPWLYGAVIGIDDDTGLAKSIDRIKKQGVL